MIINPVDLKKKMPLKVQTSAVIFNFKNFKVKYSQIVATSRTILCYIKKPGPPLRLSLQIKLKLKSCLV